jgi:uncharacterized DUF497 family protein
MMTELHFVWNAHKARINLRDHRISFGEATTVFYDENAREYYDWNHSETEDRYLMLGISDKLRMLMVCYTYRENESVIRIISARKATKTESKQYQKDKNYEKGI